MTLSNYYICIFFINLTLLIKKIMRKLLVLLNIDKERVLF